MMAGACAVVLWNQQPRQQPAAPTQQVHDALTAGRDAPDAANTLKRDPPTVYPPSWALCPGSRAPSWRVSAGDCSRARRAGRLASARAGLCTAAAQPGAAAGGWELVRRVAHAAHPAPHPSPHMRAVLAALAGGHNLTVCPAAFTTFNLHPARADRRVARRSVEPGTAFRVQRPRPTRVGAPPRITCMIDGLRAERRVSTRLRGSLTAALLRRSGGMKGGLAQRSPVWSGRLSRKHRSPARTAPRPSARPPSRPAAPLPCHLATRPCHHNVFPGVMNHTHY